MKKIIFAILFIVSFNLNSQNDTISDTTRSTNVIEVNEHLIIYDSCTIRQTIIKEKTKTKIVKVYSIFDKLVFGLIISLILLSLLNHYKKNRKNG